MPNLEGPTRRSPETRDVSSSVNDYVRSRGERIRAGLKFNAKPLMLSSAALGVGIYGAVSGDTPLMTAGFSVASFGLGKIR